MAAGDVYLNGAILPAAQAKIGITDAGFLHGASVFTTMLAHNGTVFRLDRHLRRLTDTLHSLGLRNDASPQVLREAVAGLLASSGLMQARLRITLTPGPTDGPATTLITADPLPDYPAKWYSQGISVVVSCFVQAKDDPIYGVKTGCYLPRILALREAATKGADEALWYTADKRLAEACLCNVFLVCDGRVRTPPLDTPVLPGIVREAVIELCSQIGLECDAGSPLTVHEMLGAQEMFLTASCTGIRPVARVERHVVGQGTCGPITQRIMAAYRDLLERECPVRPTEEQGR